MRKFSWLVVCLAGIAAGSRAEAAVKPHGLFTDNMVLQQGMKVNIWGTADPEEKVTVKFEGQEVSAAADKDGKWKVQLNPLKAGGPFELQIGGITLKNVLVGEVWVCSGQSNMEWPMTLSRNPKQDIAESKNPMIRLIRIPKAPSPTPRTDFGPDKDISTGRWTECGPDTVAGFSAVGYFFGRDLNKARKVPIGLIQSAWGGTAAERWTRTEIFDKYPELKGGKGSDLYNGMIAPLIPFAIKGAIWYQGESNAGQAWKYRTLHSAMIKNWRDDWKQGDFPFLFVQLAPFMKIETEPKESAWAELRDAQLYTAQTVPGTAMAVITDYGDPADIHPKDKDPVGARLALCAQALAYNEKIPYSGPEYTKQRVDGNKIVLQFKHLEGGLVAKENKGSSELTGFAICGKDQKWLNAEAKIVGDTVVVSSAQVPEPVAVRFGWANCPVVNLFNKAGLPASPFRTDNFPLTTQPRLKAGS